MLQKHGGFVTAAGTPVKNGLQTAEFLEALLLPQKIAAVKTQGQPWPV